MLTVCSAKGKLAVLLVAALLVTSVLLSGCASRFGPQTTLVEHYPDCYQPIAEMRANEFMVEESTAVGAIFGALIGGLLGYAIDGGRGAAIGASMGALTGGIVSNQYARIAQERDDQLRLQYYSMQLEETAVGMDATTAAASLARQCYERQFEAAVANYRSGYLNKEQFRARYTEVTAGLKETSRILGMTIDSVAGVSAAYQDALEAESQRLRVKPETLAQMHNQALQRAEQQRPRPQANQRRPDTQSARAQTPQPHVNTGLPSDVDEKLNTMVNNGAAVQNSVNNALAEQELINARLDLTNQIASDLLS